VGCVYQAKNLIDGKCYIGKTILSLARRVTVHKSDAKLGSTYYFHNAIRNHGFESFKWDILYQSNDEKKLLEMEKVFISLLNTIAPNGYNLTKGGEGLSGWKHSAETIAKISKPRTKETRVKLSNAHLGKKLSKEHKASISKALKGKPLKFYHRKRQAVSAATKKKISESLVGRTIPEETKRNMSVAGKIAWQKRKENGAK